MEKNENAVGRSTNSRCTNLQLFFSLFKFYSI